IVDVTVTGTGWLAAWIDFNQDGDFGDVGEMIISESVSTSTTRYNFSIPNGTTLAGEYFSRFRLFETQPIIPLASSAGYAANGEVEDYMISLQPLPVELLEFDGRWQEQHAYLHWTAAATEEVKEYVLERSFDQQSYSPIHRTEALSGNDLNHYDYLDRAVMDLGHEQYYYRVKEVDAAGKVQVSQVVELQVGESPYLNLNIYPNPVRDMMTIDYTLMRLEGENLRITNSLGQELWRKDFAIGEGQKGSVQLNTSQWAEGIYYLELTHEQGSKVWKFVVQ
ncbi:MAG: GEVED domain-containing protein, partial [Bacteroidota bacterium]